MGKVKKSYSDGEVASIDSLRFIFYEKSSEDIESKKSLEIE